MKTKRFEIVQDADHSEQLSFVRHRSALRYVSNGATYLEASAFNGIGVESLFAFHREVQERSYRDTFSTASPYSLKELRLMKKPEPSLLAYLLRSVGQRKCYVFLRNFFLLSKVEAKIACSAKMPTRVLNEAEFRHYYAIKVIYKTADGQKREGYVGLGQKSPESGLIPGDQPVVLSCPTYEDYLSLMEGYQEIKVEDVAGYLGLKRN